VGDFENRELSSQPETEKAIITRENKGSLKGTNRTNNEKSDKICFSGIIQIGAPNMGDFANRELTPQPEKGNGKQK